MTRTAKKPFCIVSEDLSPLKRRLTPGRRISGRIIDILGLNTYVLRIFGYNLVMKTRLKFERFEKIDLVVRENNPVLQLEPEKFPAKEKRFGRDGQELITIV